MAELAQGPPEVGQREDDHGGEHVAKFEGGGRGFGGEEGQRGGLGGEGAGGFFNHFFNHFFFILIIFCIFVVENRFYQLIIYSSFNTYDHETVFYFLFRCPRFHRLLQ